MAELSWAVLELSHERRRRLEQQEIRRRYGVRYYTQEQDMSAIDRIKAKALQARGIAPQAIRDFESDLDGIIGEREVLAQKRAAAVAPHKEAIAGIYGEFDGLKSAMDLLSNGGPPLEESETAASDLSTASAQLPVVDLVKPGGLVKLDEPIAIQSFISTPVDDTGEIDRIKLNSAQTG